MTLAILLLGLIVATCVIAYWADNLGKKLGKKRISLFNLRPRQTATLISMASSVGIMLLTVGILIFTSKSVSNALLRYDIEKANANRLREALIKEIEDKRQLAKQAELENARIQSRLRQTSTLLANTRAGLQKARRTQNQAVREAREALSRVAMARRGEASARARAQQALARYQQAQRRFGVLRTQLEGAQKKVRYAQQRLIFEQKRVDEANGNYARARAAYSETNNQLTNAKKQLSEAQRLRDEAKIAMKKAQENLSGTLASVEELVAEIARIENDRADLEVKRVQAQAELKSAQAELDEKTREVAATRLIAAQLQEVTERIAIGKIEFRAGTVFAEKTFEPRLPISRARSELQELLNEGRRVLQPQERRLALVAPRISSGKNQIELDENQIIALLAGFLSESDLPVSVRLASARHHAQGETEIEVRFLPTTIRTVFQQGEELAAATIGNTPAERSDARIFNQLLALLNEAEIAAKSRQVEPILSPQNPFFFTTGTNERIFEALRRIQQNDAPSRVRVVAASDITTIKPVHIRFAVEDE